MKNKNLIKFNIFVITLIFLWKYRNEKGISIIHTFHNKQSHRWTFLE